MTTSGSPAASFGGTTHVIDGLCVFCVDTAPAADARPTVVAVHGIPESSLAWREVRAVASSPSRESYFKRGFLRPCARPIDPTTLDELYDPYRRPDACRAAAPTWSAYRRGLGGVVRARRELSRISAPTTILFGARDPYCTPASARAFAARIPNARLRLLDDVGHFTPTEAPTEVADELKSLIQRTK